MKCYILSNDKSYIITFACHYSFRLNHLWIYLFFFTLLNPFNIITFTVYSMCLSCILKQIIIFMFLVYCCTLVQHIQYYFWKRRKHISRVCFVMCFLHSNLYHRHTKKKRNKWWVLKKKSSNVHNNAKYNFYLKFIFSNTFTGYAWKNGKQHILLISMHRSEV